MRNLIYQFWKGDVPPYARESSRRMREYADMVGAEYRFDDNPKVSFAGSDSEYYGAFRPIHDKSFHVFDNVLFLDMDIFPREGVSENIFEENVEDIGICEEPHQPELREKFNGGISGKNDEKWHQVLGAHWGIHLPRDGKGRLKVYNSGVVLYSRTGLKKASEKFLSIYEYSSAVKRSGLPRFYWLDSNYLHANLFAGGVTPTFLPEKWNCQIHLLGRPGQRIPRPVRDVRDESTCFVHLQIRGRDSMSKERICEIVNLPQNEWVHR